MFYWSRHLFLKFSNTLTIFSWARLDRTHSWERERFPVRLSRLNHIREVKCVWGRTGRPMGDTRGVNGPFVSHTHAFLRPLTHSTTFSLSMVFLLGKCHTDQWVCVSHDGNPTQPPQAATDTCKHTLHGRSCPVKPAPTASWRPFHLSDFVATR